MLIVYRCFCLLYGQTFVEEQTNIETNLKMLQEDDYGALSVNWDFVCGLKLDCALIHFLSETLISQKNGLFKL